MPEMQSSEIILLCDQMEKLLKRYRDLLIEMSLKDVVAKKDINDFNEVCSGIKDVYQTIYPIAHKWKEMLGMNWKDVPNYSCIQCFNDYEDFNMDPFQKIFIRSSLDPVGAQIRSWIGDIRRIRREAERFIMFEKVDKSDKVCTDLQLRILEELHGYGYTAEALANKIGKSESAVKKALKVLMDAGKVRNQRGIGYFRPDAPPKPTTDI